MFSNTILAQLPADFTEALSTGAGLILSNFDPTANLDKETIKQNILFATEGGVQTSCVFSYGDYAEGLDNVPTNTKQLLHVTGVECTMGGTAKTITSESAKSFFAHADINGDSDSNGVIEISPRAKIKIEDFKTLWFVAPYGTQKGFVAVKLSSSLNTGGFSWQSANNDKSSFPFSYKGFSDLESPEEIPFKYYMKKSSNVDTTEITPNT